MKQQKKKEREEKKRSILIMAPLIVLVGDNTILNNEGELLGLKLGLLCINQVQPSKELCVHISQVCLLLLIINNKDQ